MRFFVDQCYGTPSSLVSQDADDALKNDLNETTKTALFSGNKISVVEPIVFEVDESIELMSISFEFETIFVS